MQSENFEEIDKDEYYLKEEHNIESADTRDPCEFDHSPQLNDPDDNELIDNDLDQQIEPKWKQAEKRNHCLYCFNLEKGISILVYFQILTSLFALYHLLLRIVINPFKDDEKIHEVFWLVAISNAPRLFAGYLCYKWLQVDNEKTRQGLRWAFLLWFFVEILIMFDELVFNYALLDSTYPEYVYHKRFVLGPDHPHGLHNDMHGGYGKIEHDDAMEAIRFVESIKSYLRLLI